MFSSKTTYFFQELLKALHDASSSNPNLHRPATDLLKSWETNHFGQYLIGLCQVLQDVNVDPHVRQLAGLQIKVCVGGGRTEETQDAMTKRYMGLSQETRTHLRDAVNFKKTKSSSQKKLLSVFFSFFFFSLFFSFFFFLDNPLFRLRYTPSKENCGFCCC